MIKAGKQIAICAAGLILFCILSRFLFFRSYNAYIPLEQAQAEEIQEESISLKVEEPDVLHCGEPEIRRGYLRIPIQPEKPGESSIYLSMGDGGTESLQVLRVGRFRTVYDLSTGGFTGDTAVLIAVTLFWLLVSAIMVWHFFQAKGTAFYSYATIYYAGFFLFSLVTGLVMLQITARHIANPGQYSMLYCYSAVNNASTRFMMLTTPLMLLFAAAMAVSNIALLRHERRDIQNALGLVVSGLLIAGEAVGWYLFTRDFMGSEWEGRINSTLQNTYATVFVYFECMLVGAVVCGVKAARHEPALDKDFILILGCWFRKDGTLPPLLRGRVDKALAFWRRQKEETGKVAAFIPSGGQGRDEPMPEAEAMRRYLLSQDIPENLILPETRSENTYQNMAFSKEIIRDKQPEGKAVFATTNYHVFRSGVWASNAGLAAEGMGSKTVWWFWPNAFMRETVGLMKRRWKQEILLLMLLIAFFAVLSMVVG